MSVKIALVQTNIAWEDKNKNIETAEDFISKARSNGAEIVFFPEMSFTGFSMNTAVTAEEDDYTVNRIRELSQKYCIAIGFGWVKKCEGKAENHYTVLSEKGDILSDYVKIHPFSYSHENEFFKAGGQVSIFRYKGHVFSTLICYDLRFPELFQAVSGEADVIVVPANWPERRELHWNTLLQARAIENQSYVLGINCVGVMDGLEYNGCTSVYDPLGVQLGILRNQQGFLLVEISDAVSSVRSSFPVKNDRKWELYTELYKNNKYIS